jgi:CRP/FNR family transcriptional regulator
MIHASGVILMNALALRLDTSSCLEICEACSARETSICHVLPHPELRRLADSAAVSSYTSGEILVFEGQAANHVFNITEGVVMLFKLLSDGRRQVLGFLFKGDFLGLTGGADYSFSVQALTHVQVCRFPKPSFHRLLLETPRLEEELLSRASDELISARAHLTLLGRKTAIERVSSFLLYMADRDARLGGAPNLAFLPMTRADMADYLGLTTETVSRVISAFKRQGTIQLLAHGGVRLLQPERLKAMAERA